VVSRQRASWLFAGLLPQNRRVPIVDPVNGRLKLASLAEDFAASQRRLMAISQSTGTAFSSNANLFSRAAASMRDAGYASADVAKVTETVATSLKLSGASTEEASSVITQFSQALAPACCVAKNSTPSNGERRPGCGMGGP
jgi:hypothetical protein